MVQCEPLDRLEAFEEVIRELDREEDAKFIRERKMRARRERKNREAFVAKLEENERTASSRPECRGNPSTRACGEIRRTRTCAKTSRDLVLASCSRT